MKNIILGIIITLFILGCKTKATDYLVKFYEGPFDEVGVPCGYLNTKGDTIIPLGKYYYCYTDTIRNFGMVMEKNTYKILGIDQNDSELYEVFNYENGPDYIQSGLFRIIKNGKIGYANEDGEIIIEPNFVCAYPFKGDLAKVSDNCDLEKDGEHISWKSDNWYQIKKDGKPAKEQ